MENRRSTDRTRRARAVENAKRFWLDVLVLIVMFSFTMFLPSTKEEVRTAGPVMNLLALFITRTNSVIWAWLLVDVIRKIKYPYLDLQKMIEEKNWIGVGFLALIYGVVIHAFTAAG